VGRLLCDADDGHRAARRDLAVHLRRAGEVGELLEHRDDDHGRTLLDGEGELLDHVREFDQQGLPDVPAPTLSMTAGWHTLL
jgi:hypothetical protein